MGTAGMGVLLNYSREQETAADEDALRAVAQVYGHLGGAADLFETLKQSHPGSEGGFEIFRSHPFSDRRIEHVREFATRNGIPVAGPLLLVDATDRILASSPSAETLLGYTPRGLVGQTLSTLVPGFPLEPSGPTELSVHDRQGRPRLVIAEHSALPTKDGDLRLVALRDAPDPPAVTEAFRAIVDLSLIHI